MLCSDEVVDYVRAGGVATRIAKPLLADVAPHHGGLKTKVSIYRSLRLEDLKFKTLFIDKARLSEIP